MNNTKRRAPAVAAIVLSVIVVALATGVIVQQMASSRLSRGIAEQQQVLAAARGDLKNRATWRDDYADLSMKLGGRLPACTWSDQMPYMVSQITGLVQAHGVKVQSLQPEPMTSIGNIERFPMRIGLETSLQNVTAILKDAKNATPLLDIERLDVRNSPTEGGNLTVNMTVSSFVILDKSAAITRRRAVPVAAQPKAAPAADDRGAPAPRTSAVSPKPAAAAKPVGDAKPMGRPKMGMPEGAMARHGAGPATGPAPTPGTGRGPSGGPPETIDVQVGGKTIKVPASTSPDVIRRMQELGNGGTK